MIPAVAGNIVAPSQVGSVEFAAERFETDASPTDTAVAIRGPKTVWWVRARNEQGKEGWIVADYYKVATGSYMDEVSRCLHSAKQ